ncbi:hypothetical protein QAD02_002583 [Eretmocerus hayati]|uniref:Uncharacterized protein n=1 Tax=Eretmocerus hayati TaxID=131215 RepID=A0ACC2NJL8_9HYME|nr:hypothetical protein QAD02_002583 [Eretmocerus hayati]
MSAKSELKLPITLYKDDDIKISISTIDTDSNKTENTKSSDNISTAHRKLIEHGLSGISNQIVVKMMPVVESVIETKEDGEVDSCRGKDVLQSQDISNLESEQYVEEDLSEFFATARENPPDLEVHAAAEASGPEPAAAEFQVQAAAEPARADAGPIQNQNVAKPGPDPASRPAPDAAQEQQRVEMAHPARKFYFCHLALDHA